MANSVNPLKVTLCQWSLTLDLPWPPRGLSPNARPAHWAVLARAKKGYRARCRAIALAAGCGGVLGAPAERLAVHLIFVPPNRRSRDWDNLLASMKAGLDGVADALGVDDGRWRLSMEVVGEPLKGGVVRLELRA